MVQTEKASLLLGFSLLPDVFHRQTVSTFSEDFLPFLHRVSQAPTDPQGLPERMGRG